MTEFELLAIPLSLILGLGITNILSDLSDAVRDRERVPLSAGFILPGRRNSDNESLLRSSCSMA